MDMFKPRTTKRILVFSLSLSLFAASFTTLAAVPMAQLSTEQRLQTEAMLTQQIQRLVDLQERVEGQGKFVKAQAYLDQSRGFVLIDLSKNYLPTYREALEDLTHEFIVEVLFLLKDSITVHGVLFTYGGKDVYDYFPDERPEPIQERVPPKRTPREDASLLGGRDDLVVISADHGRYLDFGKLGNGPQTWRWQRPTVSNGIIEDTNTPHFANALSHWLFWRSYDDVITSFPRSTSSAIHAPSGEEWWKVAGRYHLQSILPNNPEVWDFGGRDPKLADYNKDINSRPKYANYLDATAVIHLHSNAGTPSARGTEVYYHDGREQSRLLGDSILCSMKEIIQANDAYADFPVDSISRATDNKGENSLAFMPSVIVEVGYHTNATDAAALLDPAFRNASMKGVEKGYRLYRQGIPCRAFEITNIPDVTGPHNTDIPAQVHYLGNPQFPVIRKTEVVSCASGWNCGNYNQTYVDSTPSPLTFNFHCATSSSSRPAATFRWRTTLTDADGVVTNAVEHSSTCTPTNQGATGIPTGTPTISSAPD